VQDELDAKAPKDSEFMPAAATFNVGTITGGTVANIGTSITIAAVSDDGCAQILFATGKHDALYLSAIALDDPTEARRRLTEVAREWTGPDRWQIATSNGPTVGNPPDKDAPADYEPIGAWQPFASADSWTDWRRPLRRVQA
jgi:hypothetical protein